RFYFFHIIPPPPTSTLFPYTTLFRSVVSVVPDDLERRACRPPLLGGQYARRDGRTQWRPRGSRADDARGAHVAPGRDADAVFHRLPPARCGEGSRCVQPAHAGHRGRTAAHRSPCTTGAACRADDGAARVSLGGRPAAAAAGGDHVDA